VVGEANDGEEAVRLASQLVPDVVLMDIRMPGPDGLEATRRILHDQRLDHVRIVILTTFDVDEYVFEALRVGASGFLVKDTDPGELVLGVRAVARGDALLSPGVARRLISAFSDRGGNQALPAGSELGRVLATVMFSDIVSSTQRAAEIGDRRWRDLLDRHDALIRRALARHGGREVKTTGDGFLALFDGPPGRSAAPWPSGRNSGPRGSTFASDCTLARSNCGETMWVGSPFTLAPGWSRPLRRVKWWCPARSGTWWPGRGSDSSIGASTTSRACRTDGTSTPSPHQSPRDPPGTGGRRRPTLHPARFCVSLAARRRHGRSAPARRSGAPGGARTGGRGPGPWPARVAGSPSPAGSPTGSWSRR
jgi:DNA-binding NarL/FixJ family response regulator